MSEWTPDCGPVSRGADGRMSVRVELPPVWLLLAAGFRLEPIDDDSDDEV